MEPIRAERLSQKGDLYSCSACSLCLLPCPVWRQKRDVRYSWQGRARALQHGAGPEDISESLLACINCGSCTPLCPEGIDLGEAMSSMRENLKEHPAMNAVRKKMEEALKIPVIQLSGAARVLLPGETLSRDRDRHSGVMELLNSSSSTASAGDDGRDLALALEAGLEIPAERLEHFLTPLRSVKDIVMSDGILKKPLKQWLPGARVRGLGEALSSLPALRKKIGPTDLYVIESRAYNSDFHQMVAYYDRLGKESGCSFNLDLNRIATPTTATSMQLKLGLEGIDAKEQINWLMEGRHVERIVVENMEDCEALQKACPTKVRSQEPVPVIHISEL